MGKNSDIEWTDHSWSPWWGCIEDGEECNSCYARAWAKRTGHDVWGLGPRRFFGEKHWNEPLRWNKQAAAAGKLARVFCASMSDVGERRSDDVGEQMDAARARLWTLIEQTPSLIWLLLTKRPQNMPALVPERWMRDGFPSNVQVGTTAGNREGWLKRVKFLLRIPCGVHFVSCEPLLGPIVGIQDQLTGSPRVDWIIAGCESGARARPMQTDWVRWLRDECVASGTAFFFKQAMVERKVVSLPVLDGKQWAEFPGT